MPMSRPSQRRLPCRSRSPVSVTTTAPTSGTAAISRPGQRARQLRLGAREQHPRDRDLDRRVREQRPPARERAARSSVRRTTATGTSSSAPIACVRRRASPARARAPQRGSSGTACPRSRTSRRTAATPRRLNRGSGSVSIRAHTEHRDDDDHHVVTDAPLADRADRAELRPEQVAAERDAGERDRARPPARP